MPGKAETGQAVYVYDGSFDGFLCCVYNLYYNNIKPVAVCTTEHLSPSFYQNIEIITRRRTAGRVKTAIEGKIYPGCCEHLKKCMLCDIPDKEMHMLRYVEKGFAAGDKVKNMLTDEDVNALFKGLRNLDRERHHYLGIVRFYKAGNVYISKIAPKNQILPLIAWHFTNRFRDMRFMIYDETNRQALAHRGGRYEIIMADNIILPTLSADEAQLQKLWKGFYDTISIKERENPKLRMNYLPKHEWAFLPELENEYRKDIRNNKRIKVYKNE